MDSFPIALLNAAKHPVFLLNRATLRRLYEPDNGNQFCNRLMPYPLPSRPIPPVWLAGKLLGFLKGLLGLLLLAPGLEEFSQKIPAFGVVRL